MPRNTIIISLALLLLLLMGCRKSDGLKDQTVRGSWNLTKYKDHRTKNWTSYGDSIMYQKHISPSYFVWFKFDKKNEKLLGLGGGTYQVNDDLYTENIEFFYPPLPDIIGESIPFEMKFSEGNWSHTGFFLKGKTDPVTAEVLSIDTVKIDEVWTRTEVAPNNQLDLVNTWKMLSFRETLSDAYIEYPDFIRFIKLITPTHFVWIKYDVQGNEVYATGAGTYTFDDSGYSETINMISPHNTGQIGETINFQFRLNDNQWYHFGYVPKLVINPGGIKRDSILIDEYWAPFARRIIY